jgi:hypothetical protein
MIAESKRKPAKPAKGKWKLPLKDGWSLEAQRPITWSCEKSIERRRRFDAA